MRSRKQATTIHKAKASQWGAWRSDRAPEVIDSAPPRIQAKVGAAREQGASFIVIDTPPHAPRMYEEATELVRSFGIEPCPHILTSRRPTPFSRASQAETSPSGANRACHAKLQAPVSIVWRAVKDIPSSLPSARSILPV